MDGYGQACRFGPESPASTVGVRHGGLEGSLAGWLSVRLEGAVRLG